MNKPSLQPEVDSRLSIGSLLAAGLIVAALFCVGLAIAAIWYSATPKIFESSATVLIEPRSRPPARIGGVSGSFDYRHDQLIGEDNIITKALIKYDLNELGSLRDLTPVEQIQHIQNNLEIQPSEETNDLYHLRFRSGNARDAQTVLATLMYLLTRSIWMKNIGLSVQTHANYWAKDERQTCRRLGGPN